MNTLITGALVLTMTGEGTGALPDGYVAVSGKQIEAVGAMSELTKEEQARYERVIDARGKAVLPGLIDGHVHGMLSLFRGVAQDMDHWMHYGLSPYSAELDEEAAVKGATLAAVEALKNGTTTLLDYGIPMRPTCEVYRKLGLRARVASLITGLPLEMAELAPGELYPLDEQREEMLFQENTALIDEYHNRGDGRITCMYGPQGPDMVTENMLTRIMRAATEAGVMIHMHVAQGTREIEQVEQRYGCRSIPYLDRLGCLDENLLAVHLTEATPEETKLLARKGAAMACCPASIAIIDGIVPPLAEFLEAGGRAVLGSDQAPGNNSHNMWNEMKLAALLNKVRFTDPKVMPAWKALRLSTVEGACAVGLGSQVGSLEPGKLADLIIVDLKTPGLSPYLEYPVRNVIPNLVYAARGHEVETVMIDGNIVVEEGRLLTADEEAVVEEAGEAAKICAGKAAGKVLRLNRGPAAMMRDGLI